MVLIKLFEKPFQTNKYGNNGQYTYLTFHSLPVFSQMHEKLVLSVLFQNFLIIDKYRCFLSYLKYLNH